jgi:uncharacterized protein (TIGR00725 family)
MNRKKPSIGIIGPNADKCSGEVYEFALKLGVELSLRDLHLVSGGKQGIMEAVFKGTKSVKGSKALTIGIIPEDDKKFANDFCDVVIPTGIGTARNKLIINTSDIIIAIAGGAGTLSEMAFAWQMRKPIIAYTQFEGWAKRLADKKIDNQPNTNIQPANSLVELLRQLDESILDF